MKYLIFFLLSVVLLLMACASTPEPATGEAVVHDTVNWNELDWHLPKRYLAGHVRWFGDDDSDPAGRYVKHACFEAAWDSLGEADFTARTESERAWRRQAADELVRDAFLTVADRAYRMRRNAKTYLYSYSGMHLVDRVMLRALAKLHTAVGTDPTNAAAWYHLAYFSAVVGDAQTAAGARARLFHLTTFPDPRRTRLLLDEAWFLRDAGRYDAAVLWLDGHAADLAVNTSSAHELAPTVEANLIRALCAAEQGHRTEAHMWISQLPLVEVPWGLNTLDSEFLRTWVHVWAELRTGYPDLATNHLSHRRAVRLPAGVAWRYWQDLGLVCEELGDSDEARRFWDLAYRSRPYLGFFPYTAFTGTDRILGRTATGEPYFVAYRRFFTVGSIWGFSATRTLACQLHDVDEDPDLWDRTITSLDVCVRRGIHGPEARLLRARLNLQRGDLVAAEVDLRHAAIEQLVGSDAEADVVFLRGVAALNTGEIEASITPLQRCVELEPNHVRGWQSLAIASCYLGRDAEALAAYARVERLQPQDGVNYFNRGLLHLQEGRTEAAEADLIRAATLLPDKQRAIELLQAVASGREVTVDLTPQPVQLVASNDERELAASLDRLLASDALDPQLREMLAGTAEEQEMWLELLDHRYEDEPTAENRRQLAEARAQAGDQAGVVALLAPGWPLELLPRERVLLLDADRVVGEVDRAAAVAGDQVPADVLDVPVLIRATTILLDHGRTEEARRVLAKALVLAPDEPALRDLAARLS